MAEHTSYLFVGRMRRAVRALSASCMPFMWKGIYFHAALANDLVDDVLCQLRLIANSCYVEGGGGVHSGGMQRGGPGGAGHSSHRPLNSPKVGTMPFVRCGGF